MSVPDKISKIQAGSLIARSLAPVIGDKRHFYLIDLIRGLAAITVVIFHYQNFAIPSGSTEQVLSVRDAMPMRYLLWPIYDYGRFAVQLFWLISGFVFTGVYAGHGHSTRYFLSARIARLYPLHLLTLLVVAALQLGRLHWLGSFAIYQENDAYHFLLHLFMASDWGFQRGPSFNAPIWSVSIEILIYAVFWLTAPRLYRWGIVGPLLLAMIFALGGPLKLPGTVLWQCGFYFFAGSATHVAYSLLGRRAGWLAGVGMLGVAAVAAVLMVRPINPAFLMPALLPSLFLIICGAEVARPQLPAWARAIGDMTYGVYLWHLTLILIALMVMDGVLGTRRVILQPSFLVIYVVVIVLIGWMSHRYIEKPAKRFVMRHIGPKRDRFGDRP